jgi:hypothetical protein
MAPGLSLLHGVALDRELHPSWEEAGVLDDNVTFEKARGAAGLYAFVLEGGPILYLGKAGGLKPGESSMWANDIKARLAGHWKTGPFRGLVRTTGAKIQVWIMDVRKVIDRIWERDIERIENELIDWLRRENANNIPGNTACEGTSARGFRVQIDRATTAPMPRVILQVGTSPDTRRVSGYRPNKRPPTD